MAQVESYLEGDALDPERHGAAIHAAGQKRPSCWLCREALGEAVPCRLPAGRWWGRQGCSGSSVMTAGVASESVGVGVGCRAYGFVWDGRAKNKETMKSRTQTACRPRAGPGWFSWEGL